MFDPRQPTALFVGRYQPFHEGHRLLIEEGLRRIGQACVAVREGSGAANPLPFEQVAARIEVGLRAHAGRFALVRLPTITKVACRASGTPVALETNGTVRLARGFTSRT